MFIFSRVAVGIVQGSSGRQMEFRDSRAVLMQINSWSITWRFMQASNANCRGLFMSFQTLWGATFLDPTAYYYSILEPRSRHGSYNSQTDSAILLVGETFLKEKEKNVFMFANTFLHLQMYCEYKKLN